MHPLYCYALTARRVLFDLVVHQCLLVRLAFGDVQMLI